MLANGLYVKPTDRVGKQRRKKRKQAHVPSEQESTLDLKQLARILGFVVALSAVVLGIVLVAGWVTQPAAFPIKEIRIDGDLNYTNKAKISSLVQPHLTEGFFGLDVVEIYSAVQSDPWVKEASVKRRWPNVLIVEVIEHQPFATWKDKAIVTQKGELIYPDAVRAKGLPLLYGPESRINEVVETYLSVQQQLSLLEQNIDLIKVDERGAWHAELENGIQLKFGRTNIMEKMQRLSNVFDVALKQHLQKIMAIDLRYNNGISIRWRDEQRAVGL